VRLFIALCPDETLRTALVRLQEDLRAAHVGGNYTAVENLHLTLAFIGEYGDPDRVLDVLRAVPMPPFPLRLEGFGCFDDLLWCGVAAQEELTAYVRRLRRALALAEIPFDRKRFVPHITLLRRARFDRLPALCVPPTAMEAFRVSLMRSQPGRGGVRYTVLGETGCAE